jgi:butyryl-CoA dehydrogenase
MNFQPTDEQLSFQREVERFAAERVAPVAREIDETAAFPRALIKDAAALGLMGVTIDREWSGAGRDYVAYALAMEALARSSAVVAVIAAVNNSLVAEPLAEFGSRAQKETWLPSLVSGDAIGSFALSEEFAGSDAANQQTAAIRQGRTYRLRGRKVWVANAEAADVAIVFATTEPGRRGRGICAFVVPMNAAGLRKVGIADSLGVRGLGCMDLELNDVEVDEGAMLGGAGEGFRVAMWALDGGRVAIAAQALGVGSAALDHALEHAKTREAFGQPIANYEAIQWMLADMATELEAARLLTLKAADVRARQSKQSIPGPARVDAAMAKLLASESAHRAADKAMQILASQGYRRGSDVERLFRDVRATEIYQGTSEVQRMLIAEQILK